MNGLTTIIMISNQGFFSFPIGRREERMETNKLVDNLLIKYQ